MFYKKNIDSLRSKVYEYMARQAILYNDIRKSLNEKQKATDKTNERVDTLLQMIQKATDKTNERVDTLLQMIEGHDKLLQQLIPTINKQTQKYKKLEENYQMLVKVVEKIVTKIDPEWKSKTVNINKEKKGK